MPRLRRTDSFRPGWTRRRRGRGFSDLDEQGRPCPPRRSSDAEAWASPRPGRTCGSARTRTATSRRSAPTRQVAGSTSTTSSGACAELLAWRDEPDRGPWHDVRSADINAYVQSLTRPGASAKDSRTWQSAVLALEHLASSEPASSLAARRRQVAAAMSHVAEHLGNTPRVVRTSHVDPRLVERYLCDGELVPRPDGRTTDGAVDDPEGLARWESALLELLQD